MPLLLVQPRGTIVKNTNLEGGFYDSLRVPFLMARCTGLLPLSGLMHRTSKHSGLNWKSWYTLIYIISIFIQTSQLLLIVANITLVGCNSENITEFCIVCMILFVVTPTFYKIAKHWERDIKAIEELEMLLPRITNRRKTLIVFLIFNILLALAHYILSCSYILGYHARCRTISVFEYFIRMDSYNFALNYLLGSALLLKRLINYFILASVDTGIILISSHLNTRIKCFNSFFDEKINQAHMEKPNWRELQMCFTRLSRIVRVVNGNINPLVLVSLFINLLYLSHQIFIILNNLTKTNVYQNPNCLDVPGSDYITISYICFTFTYISMKVVAVILTAAEIHTLSREPLNALYKIPPSAYDHEFQKFMTQIYRSKVCLSGLNLFNITRGTLLTIVANLMTYELVLLQI